MLDSFMLFQTDGETEYWSDSVFNFYPTVNRELFRSLTFAEKREYLAAELGKIYDGQEESLNQKVTACNLQWQRYRGQIEAALSDAFNTDVRPLFNDLRAEICLNPVSPRFLAEHRFEVFSFNSEHGAIGISIHEIIHFLWFYVWNKEFKDSYDEYERPSLKWILSEMVVESIMRDERLSSINPYFPRENGGCVYEYFWDMKADGRMVLDVIEELYQCGDMKKFMAESYAYCQKHEDEIRSHITEAEKLCR